MEKMKVVAALIDKNGSIILGQIRSGSYKGKWEVPLGLVSDGEITSDLIRDIVYKKLHVSVKSDYLIGRYDALVEDKQVEIAIYHCTYLSGEVISDIYNEHILVDKSLLLSYDLTPLALEIVKLIVNNSSCG